MKITGYCAIAVVLATACNSGPEHDREALMDPQTCAECHPQHFRQWQGSMHAYAAEDPVFRAMNARGQRETNGELGDFCVRCHAPLATALGLTEDGLNLDEVPRHLQGVTCYFCHNVSEIAGTHNNPLVLAMDTTMRGGISDPVPTTAHGAAYSSLLDGGKLESGAMCGTCHDIVTPAGVHLERTFAEWQASFYSDPDPDDPSEPYFYAQTCNACHLPGSTGPIADAPDVRADRRLHDHKMVGVDRAITDFPNAELGAQLRAEQDEAIATARITALCASLCVSGDAGNYQAHVWLHNEGAGHAWPSGAAADRRAWLELNAYTMDSVVYQTGVVGPGEPVAELDDPDLWLIRDRTFDENGDEAHMFWDVRDYESSLLPVPDDVGGDATTWQYRSYGFVADIVDRVEMSVHLRAIGFDVLQDLVDSGDLDPALLDAFVTDSVPGAELRWEPDIAEPSLMYGSCVVTAPGCQAPGLFDE